jgi:uncharacterized protein HemY
MTGPPVPVLRADGVPPAATDRLVWSAVLLALFFTLIRPLGDRIRPADDARDCDHISPGDTAALGRCIDLRPGDVQLLTDLGNTYEAAGQWDRAEAAYRRALTFDPADGDLRVRLGTVLLRRGDTAGARQEAAAALAVQPNTTAPLELARRAASTPGTAGQRP